MYKHMDILGDHNRTCTVNTAEMTRSWKQAEARDKSDQRTSWSQRVRRDPEHPSGSSKDAHRSVVNSRRSKPIAVANRSTMATTMGLSELSKLQDTIATLFLQDTGDYYDHK